MKLRITAAAIAAALFSNFLPSMAAALIIREASIDGMTVSRCLANRKSCVVVTSPRADASLVGTIYYMKSMDVKFIIPDTNRVTQHLTNKKGYIDFANSQLVLIDKKGKTETEIVYQLSDFKEKVYKVGVR